MIFFKKVKDEFDRKIGILLLHEAISKLNLKEILTKFSEHKQLAQIYKILSEIKHPLIDEFLDLQVQKSQGLISSVYTSKV